MTSPANDRETYDWPETKDKQSSTDVSPTLDNGPNVNDNSNRRKPPDYLKVDTAHSNEHESANILRTPSARREQATRLEDDLLLLQAERVASRSTQSADHGDHASLGRSRSRRTEPIDEFDEATNPLHEKAAVYRPPETPNTKLSAFVKKVHQSSFIVRYFTYIVPLVLLLLIPLLVGALKYKTANVGGVKLMWFAIWLEIVWLTLWAGRVSVALIMPAKFVTNDHVQL